MANQGQSKAKGLPKGRSKQDKSIKTKASGVDSRMVPNKTPSKTGKTSGGVRG